MSRPTVLTTCTLGLPFNPGCINRNHTHGTHAPLEEPSTASKADILIGRLSPKEEPRDAARGFDCKTTFRFLRQPSRPGAARPPTNPRKCPYVMRLTLNHDVCD